MRGSRGHQSLRRRVLRWGLLTVLAGFLLGVAAFAYGYASTDIPDPNKAFQTQTTFVYYDDARTELGRFQTQNRQSIPLSDVPRHVQDAVVAAENRTFWTDQGIDPRGILRAAFSNATSDSTQGASTITQQYVKVLYLSQEQSLTRKVKEAFLSLKIQRQRTKAQILGGYLNTIYFGRGAYGIQAAAQAYFGEDAADLNIREGAVLAAVLNSPGDFDPADGKDSRRRLLGRYRYVVDGMVSMGVLPADRGAQVASRLPRFPKIEVQDQFGGPKGHLLMLVKQELRERGFSDAQIQGGGLRVTTTFGRDAQRAAVRAVASQRPTVNAKGVRVALAAVEPGTGALKAMYGGPDYVQDQRNWALTGRQPGSAFKPFALAAGLTSGFSLFDTFTGNTYVFPDGREVGNEFGTQYGTVSLLRATEASINTAYVDLTMSMPNGPQRVIDAAVKAGIPRDTPGLEPDPTITLGTADVRPVDLATAYATFANQGRRADWFVIEKVTDRAGKVLYRSRPRVRRVFPADVTSNVVQAMRQVVLTGTGTAARAVGCPVAGKTGTAALRPDTVTSAWFAGYTPRLSAAVMYVKGRSGTQDLDGVGGLPTFFGGAYPARTFTAFFSDVLAGRRCVGFPPVDYVNGTPAPAPVPSTPAEPVPTPTAPHSDTPQPSTPPSIPTPSTPPPSPPPSHSPSPSPPPPSPPPPSPPPRTPPPSRPPSSPSPSSAPLPPAGRPPATGSGAR